MKPKEKFCPILSINKPDTPCSSNCKWYISDAKPGKCAIVENIVAFNDLWEVLTDIHIAIPDGSTQKQKKK